MNNSRFWSGVLFALASACSFGLIPLFAVPLINNGISPEMAVFYRFGLAALAMPPILSFMKIPMKISIRQASKLALLALFYFLDVQLFFYAFKYLASGVVATLEFLAPVFVLLIMISFFHQKFHWQAAAATILALLGVWLLGGGMDMEITPTPDKTSLYTGVILALLSALFLAFYLIGCEIGHIDTLDSLTVTFYLMLFGAIYCGFVVIVSGKFALPDNLADLARAMSLALVTAIFSNWTLLLAIKRVGSVLTSIMGVMEPLTALIIGVLVFKEKLSFWAGAGALVVILAAMLATFGEKKGRDKPTF